MSNENENENFPRSDGSFKRHLPNRFSAKKSSHINEDEQLFKSRKNVQNLSILKKKKFNRSKKTTLKKSQESSKLVIETLNLSRLIENTVVYGCLQQITDFELKFSITGGITVTVPLTNVSDSYTGQVEDFAQNSSSNGDLKIAKLSSMFNIGDYFPVKICSKNVCGHFGNINIIGSINPKDIYKNFNLKTFQKLPQGYNLVAAVSSKEDYGYSLDLGSKELKAFLLFEDLKKNSMKVELIIGQLIQCSLFQINERSLILTVNKKLSNFCFDQNQDLPFHSITAGIKMKCLITRAFNSGLELSLPSGHRGFVTKSHLGENLMASIKQFKPGSVVEGYVLYVHLYTKQVCMSLKKKLDKKSVLNLLGSIKIGTVFENSIVQATFENGNLVMKLPTNDYAIVLRKNLQDSSETKGDKDFSTGTSHLCKVKKFHLFDNIIEVSLKESFIKKEVFSLENLKIGSIVEGMVKKINDKGVYVKLGYAVNGFIPNIHLTDSPFVNLGKNREKLFPIGKNIKCRVTRMDFSSFIVKISLTAKKSLLKMNESDLFINLDEISPGKSTTGIVCLASDKGILLEFFNRLRGFIPLKYIATYKIEHPEKVFQLGQLAKCTVVSVDQQSQRIVCSLIDVNVNKNLKIKTELKNKQNLLNSSLRVGQILNNLKIISKTSLKGLDLVNSKEDIQVFLPLAHLSDDPYVNRLLFTSLKVGEIIKKVMVFSKDQSEVVCVTRKDAFLNPHFSLIMREEDIELESPFPAVVRRATATGVFFEIPNSFHGVIRKNYIQDKYHGNPEQLKLYRGQTIFVKALDIFFNKPSEEPSLNSNCLKRFKFSMKLSDVWNKDSSFQIRIMNSYLDNFSWTQTLLKSLPDDSPYNTSIKNLASYSIGQIVTFVITEINCDHIKVKVCATGNKNEPTVTGIAFRHSDFGNFTVSQMGNAIVCDIDFDQKSLIIFVQPHPAKLIRQVKNSSQMSNLNKIKLEQSIKGTVIYVNAKYALISLNGHLPGVIAWMPMKKHYNDLRELEKLVNINETYQFLVKFFDENKQVIVALNTISSKTFNEQNKTLSQKTTSIEKSHVEQKNIVEEKKMIVEKKLEAKSLLENESIEIFDWSVPDLPQTVKRKSPNDEENENESDINFWDSDSDEDQPKKKRKTREERNREAFEREAYFRQKEEQLADINRTPRTEQDFEMAVLASPNSSIVWLKYMAMYLEQEDVKKARELGERALQTISFREEKEKFNLWIGLLNLENVYGDESTMNLLIEKAVQFNDPKAIYLQLANIYDTSNKKEKAEQVYNLMIRRFKLDPSVWIDFILFYMKNDRLDSARKFFQKSLISLEKRDHIDVISKFAQMEFRYGDREQGKTIFESLLATYWKRLDKWSIYIDMLIKYTLTDDDQTNVDALEFIRNVFERLLTFKLTPRKMKFIYKKYYEFEEKYSGDNVQILERLRQQGAQYFENVNSID